MAAHRSQDLEKEQSTIKDGFFLTALSAQKRRGAKHGSAGCSFGCFFSVSHPKCNEGKPQAENSAVARGNINAVLNASPQTLSQSYS